VQTDGYKTDKMDLNFPELSFPQYSFKIRHQHDVGEIFDSVRRKYVRLTPEEWVRQHIVMYLVHEKKFPVSRLSVEHALKYNQLSRRADIVFFGKYGQPLLVTECKAPEIKINQQVFDQVVRYNYVLKVKYIMVSNGIQNYCCEVDYEKQKCNFLNDIPEYSIMYDD
jgi:hypothetical protein